LPASPTLIGRRGDGYTAAGADMLEMDVHSTADDVLVVMHEA
jgi:glycerophosphoryl diester phosphodiesterase